MVRHLKIGQWVQKLDIFDNKPWEQSTEDWRMKSLSAIESNLLEADPKIFTRGLSKLEGWTIYK